MSADEAPPPSRLRSFGRELRRRRVFRVAVIYAAASWVAVEVSDTVAPLLLLPEWTSTLVLVLLLLGIPLALGLAWSFDITTEGMRRTEAASSDAASSKAVGSVPASSGTVNEPLRTYPAFRELVRPRG